MLHKFTSFVKYVANNFDNSYTYPAHVIKSNVGTWFSVLPAGLMFATLQTNGKHGKLHSIATLILGVLGIVALLLCGFGYCVFMLCIVMLDIVIGKYICYRPSHIYNHD